MSEAQIKENEAEQEIVEESEPSSENDEAGESDNEEDQDTAVVISFGGEPEEDSEPEPEAPSWVKDLRKSSREDKKRIKELEKQLKGKTEEEEPLGARPTMEQCDYDEDVYVKSLDEWNSKKQKHESKEAKAKAKQDEQNAAWGARQGEFTEASKSFDKDDFDESRDIVASVLNNDQQTLMVHVLGADAANVTMGLGSNEKELEAISQIKDQFLFTAALVELKAKMTVTKRKPKHAPETKVSGSASLDLSDSTLEKLEAEADRTNDRTKVQAYKRKLRNK